MSHFQVVIEFDANGQPGLNTVDVEAQIVIPGPDWIQFFSDFGGNAENVVAAFPSSRVVSVVRV